MTSAEVIGRVAKVSAVCYIELLLALHIGFNSMSFRLTKQGFSFSYKRDVLTYRWPWARGYFEWAKTSFTSELVQDFNGFADYWLKRGQIGALLKNQDKVTCFSYRAVLADWTRRTYPDSYVLALVNINSSVRINEFWCKLPKGTGAMLAQSDVAIFKASDRTEALNLSASIPPDLADSYLFVNGELLDSNLWRDE